MTEMVVLSGRPLSGTGACISATVHAPESVPATLTLPASTRATLQTGSAIHEDRLNEWTGFGTFVVRITEEES